MELAQQQDRFQKNWEQNKSQFGKTKWDPAPDFLFFIEIPLPTQLVSEMETLSFDFQKNAEDPKGLWIPSKKMHITLALPGRMGYHFQGNDANVMHRELKKITAKVEPFSVQLENINCFPNAIFREVIDKTGALFELHKKICKAIPFAQSPEYQLENFLPHITLYYGDKNQKIIQNPDFERTLPPTTMQVERIFFGKAINKNDEYEKHILHEYALT